MRVRRMLHDAGKGMEFGKVMNDGLMNGSSQGACRLVVSSNDDFEKLCSWLVDSPVGDLWFWANSP